MRHDPSLADVSNQIGLRPFAFVMLNGGSIVDTVRTEFPRQLEEAIASARSQEQAAGARLVEVKAEVADAHKQSLTAKEREKLIKERAAAQRAAGKTEAELTKLRSAHQRQQQARAATTAKERAHAPPSARRGHTPPDAGL